MSIACEHCLPPLAMLADGVAVDRMQMASGTWWRYTLTTRSGLNTATGVTEGTADAVLQRLNKLLARMEHNERPYGPTWRGKVLRNQSIQLSGEM